MRNSKEIIINNISLDVILNNHLHWLKEDTNNWENMRADLRYADLSNANLSDADLRYADLRYANLSNADLRYADLRYANLSNANLSDVNLSNADLRCANLSDVNLSNADLRYADLRYANLSNADLSNADLRCADLSNANLSDVNLSDVNLSNANLSNADLSNANLSNIFYNEATSFFALQCPEEGSFIAYKKARRFKGDVIVKLLVTENAKRSSSTTRKCRCSEAKVLSFYDCSHNELSNDTFVWSSHDRNFIYKIGEIVKPTEPFDDNRWNECSTGIHFFITFDEAKNY